MRNFVIIAEPRSGSGHLCRFLDNVNNIRMWKNDNIYEIIHPIHFGRKGFCVSYDLAKKALQAYYGSGESEYIRGSKILTIQIMDDLEEYLQECNLKVVLLTRQDKERQILSWTYANISNYWHNIDNKNAHRTVVIKPKLLRRSIEHYRRSSLVIKRYMKLINEYLPIQYEDVISNHGKKEVLNFIGEEWKEEYLSSPSEQKIAEDYRTLIVNYDECIDIIRNNIEEIKV